MADVASRIDKSQLLEMSVIQFSRLAGGSDVNWSRWFTGDRNIKTNSLLRPASRLGLTPGELLDLILERRRRCVQEKMDALDIAVDSLSESDRASIVNSQVKKLLRR